MCFLFLHGYIASYFPLQTTCAYLTFFWLGTRLPAQQIRPMFLFFSNKNRHLTHYYDTFCFVFLKEGGATGMEEWLASVCVCRKMNRWRKRINRFQLALFLPFSWCSRIAIALCIAVSFICMSCLFKMVNRHVRFWITDWCKCGFKRTWRMLGANVGVEWAASYSITSL